jgi:hypothetical protein
LGGEGGRGAEGNGPFAPKKKSQIPKLIYKMQKSNKSGKVIPKGFFKQIRS